MNLTELLSGLGELYPPIVFAPQAERAVDADFDTLRRLVTDTLAPYSGSRHLSALKVKLLSQISTLQGCGCDPAGIKAAYESIKRTLDTGIHAFNEREAVFQATSKVFDSLSNKARELLTATPQPPERPTLFIFPEREPLESCLRNSLGAEGWSEGAPALADAFAGQTRTTGRIATGVLLEMRAKSANLTNHEFYQTVQSVANCASE